jgi:hypothetical protein
MAIDEYRKDFVRVPWGGSGTVSYDDLDGLQRFDQVWFAGNHAESLTTLPKYDEMVNKQNKLSSNIPRPTRSGARTIGYKHL